MKAFSSILALVLCLTFSLNSLKAQDSQSYEKHKREMINTQKLPAYAPRGPLSNENSIPFLSNCPQSDRPTCLKEEFDTVTWTKIPMTFSTDGYRNDDGSSALILLPFTFNLYGTLYTSLYINNNGNITFDAPLSAFTPSAFPSTVFGAIVAPFFADVDTRNIESGIVYMKMSSNRLSITWDSVGYFGEHADLRCTFQCQISDGTDPFLGLGNNVCFSYGQMAWTTGDASSGEGGFGPPSTAATIGVNKGDGITYATLGRFCRPGSYYGGPAIDTNGVYYLDCQNYCLNATNAGNICPVAQNFPPGNLVVITAGTPYSDTYSFAAPEIGQLTTGGVSGVPPGMLVTITNGLTASFLVEWNPSCTQAGQYNVCFTGADNADPPCTTEVCVTYVVDCPSPVEMSSFTSNVNGRNVELNWTTNTETNNSKFEIERGVNNNWNKVGEVTGHGNSEAPINYSYVDRSVNSGTYGYRLKQIDYNGSFTYHNLNSEVVVGVPVKFELMQNYPNPFNPTTKIQYAMPVDGYVSITVFDNSGKEVSKLVNEYSTSGYHSVDFNGSNLASGIYFYKLDIKGNDNFVQVRKMILVK